MRKSAHTQSSNKLFRDMEKKAALSDAEKARKATLEKTQRLRTLRLAKEAAHRAAVAETPTKKKKAKKKSPVFG